MRGGKVERCTFQVLIPGVHMDASANQGTNRCKLTGLRSQVEWTYTGIGNPLPVTASLQKTCHRVTIALHSC